MKKSQINNRFSETDGYDREWVASLQAVLE